MRDESGETSREGGVIFSRVLIKINLEGQTKCVIFKLNPDYGFGR